ncbi:MAG: hypothetical protein KF760_24640 [Candidatus Eremiobacteraeota bacterium]|nr:hypothetical protein [Candidatus Eremiobacteraeota bacterium]MCW5871290.1 hypothetical protein [Candidatus Eremiobacteraeota bacterium]
MRKTAITLTLGLACALGALADIVRPTVAGTLESASGNQVVIKSETGTMWRAELQPGSHCEWMGSNRTLGSIPKGAKVMLRVVGSMTDKPLKVDLLSDWGSSSKYVATAAPSPYYTKMGDMVGPGGVGGKPPNAPQVGKTQNVGAFAVNGGFPHQNQENIPNILAAKAQDPGVASINKGTPGFQMGPVPPPPSAQTPSQPVEQPAAADPYQQQREAYAAQQQQMMMQQGGPQNSYPNAYQTMPANPAMSPGLNGANPMMMNQPGMNPYAMNTQTHGLESLLNGGEENGAQDQGGPMFPGMYNNQMSMGQPIQMQATVIRCDPATRSLVVQSFGSQIPQNVIVNPQSMMPMLREGQTVMISGSTNPQGFIEAQQVMPMGQ